MYRLLLIVLVCVVYGNADCDICVFAEEECATNIRNIKCSGLNLTKFPVISNPLVTKMDASNNLIESIPVGSFKLSMTQLAVLHLNDNHITRLDERLFPSLPELVWLYLNDNQLSGLCEKTFYYLKLTILNLANNLLEELPTGLFHRATMMQELHLESNRLYFLPNTMFNNMTSLQSLYVQGNHLTFLSKGLFTGLHSLSTLDLSYNQISTIEIGTFGSGLNSLNDLYLNHNELTAITTGMFIGLSSVKELYLQENNFSVMEPLNMDHLLRLDFSKNRLTSIDKNVFQNATALTWIYFEKNLLKTLPKGIFDNMHGLKTVCMSNNEIRKLPENLLYPTARQVATYSEGNLLVCSPLQNKSLDCFCNTGPMYCANNSVVHEHGWFFCEDPCWQTSTSANTITTIVSTSISSTHTTTETITETVSQWFSTEKTPLTHPNTNKVDQIKILMIVIIVMVALMIAGLVLTVYCVRSVKRAAQQAYVLTNNPVYEVNLSLLVMYFTNALFPFIATVSREFIKDNKEAVHLVFII
eukprot:m.52445 g.52445  ORF g.52445 m.52445 type:complete len:528 (+) comp10792_c1_seq1:309-1892(+)